MSDTDRRALQCRSYRPGHAVHYIQARQAARHAEGRRHGDVTSVAGQIVELALDDGEVVELRTHDAARVEHLLAERGSRAEYYPRWSLLAFRQPEGVAQVSVSTSADIGPCQQAEEGGTLMRPEEGEDPTEFTARLVASLTGRSHDG